MLRIHRGTLLKAAMPAALSVAALSVAALSVAALLAAGGAQAALASPATATAGVTSAVATGVRAAHAPDGYYAMRLSRSSVAVRAGHRTSIAISFLAPAALYGVPVALSISGLPSGVTASFSPGTATIGGHAVLTLTAARSLPAGTFAVTVTAMSLSSDPIGTTAPLSLTTSAP
jgi:carbohydrate-binding DOMON domain-containing protein